MRIKLRKCVTIIISFFIVSFLWQSWGSSKVLFQMSINEYSNVQTTAGTLGSIGNAEMELKNTLFIKNKHNVSQNADRGSKESNKSRKEDSMESSCNNMTMSEMQMYDGWKSVEESNRIYVYSAFVDGSKIKMIAAKQTLKKTTPYCRLWFKSSRFNIPVIPAKWEHIMEGKNKMYTSAFYSCDLPKDTKENPYAISLVTEKCQQPQNTVPVHYYTKQIYNFTVCVTPLNFNYSRGYELVEMIELNRILGAEHFIFYNYSINWNVAKILEYYQKQGIVEVLRWNLPMNVDTWPRSDKPVEIHYFAQLGALNDCLYRNVERSKYLVYQDLDEFIIPRKNKNWKDMMESLPKDQAAYSFRNTFYRKEWPDTETSYTGKDIAMKYKSVTLLKLKREDKIFRKSHRSKYIVNPKYIDTVGIHNIWRIKNGKKSYFVDQEVALLHHYRNWENPKDPVARKSDDRVMIYKDELLERLKNVWTSIGNVPLGPL